MVLWKVAENITKTPSVSAVSLLSSFQINKTVKTNGYIVFRYLFLKMASPLQGRDSNGNKDRF